MRNNETLHDHQAVDTFGERKVRTLAENVDLLSEYVAEMERERNSAPLANDIFEAAWYWRDLGRFVIKKNTRVNFPARASEEGVLLNQLEQAVAEKRADVQLRYRPVFDTARDILKVVAATEPPNEGHLGILQTLDEKFAFLQTDYKFVVVAQEPTGRMYSSDAVWLELDCSSISTFSCTFGPEPKDGRTFWPEDLLFVHKDRRYLELQEQRRLESTSDVETWFQFLADVWRTYGRDVLMNSPGVFDLLDAAQKQRDAEYTAAMNELHGDR
jgi:hypothetical protein